MGGVPALEEPAHPTSRRSRDPIIVDDDSSDDELGDAVALRRADKVREQSACHHAGHRSGVV